jgi:hypothetical protein
MHWLLAAVSTSITAPAAGVTAAAAAAACLLAFASSAIAAGSASSCYVLELHSTVKITAINTACSLLLLLLCTSGPQLLLQSASNI